MTGALLRALTIPGVEAGVWQVRHQADPAAVRLANRHYSRERQSNQVGGPGFRLILVTPCEMAVWISKRHSPSVRSKRILADGYPVETYRCAMFRNEGTGDLSSELIREATRITENLWGPAECGWQTYVDTDKIASRNPGYCFKQAGWRTDGARGSKLSLILPASVSGVNRPSGATRTGGRNAPAS
jgi:hypothetical protein